MTAIERSPAEYLRQAIARFSPEIAKLGRGAIARLRKRMPTAVCSIYDSYNSLGVGFGPTDSARGTIVSIVLYPKLVRLFFLQAMRSELDDPDHLLQGKGSMVRSIPLTSPGMIDAVPVQRLIAQAVERARTQLPTDGKSRLVLKSIAKTRRPRRP